MNELFTQKLVLRKKISEHARRTQKIKLINLGKKSELANNILLLVHCSLTYCILDGKTTPF